MWSVRQYSILLRFTQQITQVLMSLKRTFVIQETSYAEIFRKLNETEIQIVQIMTEKSRVESELERSRHRIQASNYT